VKVTVAVVGRLKETALAAIEDDYRKRLRRYCSFAVTEHKDEAALVAALPTGARLFALDERGDLVSSHDLAELIRREELHGGGAPLVFAIGGADGHTEVVRQRAARLIAFGRITIAHRLVRVLLLEQLYRAYSIVRGEPYHRD